MKPFAAAPTAIPRSGIREIMDIAWATPGVIHLGVGQPDFDTPPHIVEATCAHARAGHTRYVPNSGVHPLREAAARYVQGKTGVATGPENILVRALNRSDRGFLGFLSWFAIYLSLN